MSYEEEAEEDYNVMMNELKGLTQPQGKTSDSQLHELERQDSEQNDYDIKKVDVAFLHSEAKAFITKSGNRVKFPDQ